MRFYVARDPAGVVLACELSARDARRAANVRTPGGYEVACVELDVTPETIRRLLAGEELVPGVRTLMVVNSGGG